MKVVKFRSFGEVRIEDGQCVGGDPDACAFASELIKLWHPYGVWPSIPDKDQYLAHRLAEYVGGTVEEAEAA